MKKFSFILLFSFFLLIPNVNAQYYLIPNNFELKKENNQLNPDFDFGGINDGQMSSVKTLNGNSNTWYRFEFDLDGSNCSTNIDSSACFDTIHAIEDRGVSNTIYGSFQMCVSKPQFHWVVDWSTCNSNCLQKSQDLVIINNSYSTCTLGLYNTETGGTLENDGYLVDVYYNIAKWEYIEGAYSGVVNGIIYLYNDSDSILYYRFVNNVYLSDINMASLNSGFGVFNHDYSNPDVGGETFLNNGTCVKSYNKLDVFKYSNNWNRQSETFTFNNNLNYEKLPNGKNLVNINDFIGRGLSYSNGVYTIDGSVDRFSKRINTFNLPAGTYKLSANMISGSINDLYGVFYCGNDAYYLSSNKTITTNCTITGIQFYVSNTSTTISFNNAQLERGSYYTSYQPYGGYYIEYDNLDMDMGVFHYYGTNLNSPNNIYIYLEDYEGDTQLFDMVNCRNNYVCKYENYFSFTSEITNLFNPEVDRVKKLKMYYVGYDNIYFENPYMYDLYQVPGRATWKDYYQPYGEYICGDNENGTFYNAQTKKVYYNPDNPPQIVSSNPNGQSQNIFGIEVDFYGLSSLFSIPIDIYNNISNGAYNNCTPLVIPFPYFNDENLTIPCMTNYAYNRFPELLAVYRIIMYGIISLKIGVGTIHYIKKWYDGTIEGGE